jgi:hypothetical protein
MTEWCKYRDTGFLWCEIDEGKKMWRRELDNGTYYAVLYEKAVRPIANGTGIRYCVAYHGGSENYWEFTTHEAAMKRVRELIYGVEKKLGKE